MWRPARWKLARGFRVRFGHVLWERFLLRFNLAHGLFRSPIFPGQVGRGLSMGFRLPSVVWLKSFLGPVLSEVVRALERLLPVRVLHALAAPYGRGRAYFDPRPPACWPAFLGEGVTARAARRHETRRHLSRLLEILPDRLSSPRWLRRCQIAGLDRLREVRRSGRPVILAFSHFGPFYLITYWLRAHGIPATALKLGTAETRSPTQRYRDRYKPFPMIPSVLYLDQLREVVRVLAAGGIMVVSIDYPAGRLLEVPLGEGWTFRMATGAVRLAARHGAELIPCNMIQAGPWRYRLELGQSVPREHLTGDADLVAAGKHLIAESLPHWHRHPEQCDSELQECFQPVPTLAT